MLTYSEPQKLEHDLGPGLMLGVPVLNLEAMRTIMFQLSGYYTMLTSWNASFV